MFENNNLKMDISNSLKKGFSFLSSAQLESGEFPLMRWEGNHIKEGAYVKTVFATSLVLHSSTCLKKELDNKMGQKAIKFLLNEEENGLWRFYGKGSNIHFDIDTISCTLASLKEWQVNLDFDYMADSLHKYVNDQGTFNTWILDIEPPFEKKDNNIDWVVNANAMFFYSLLGRRLHELENFLIKVVETGIFKQRSTYYNSPLFFIYCITRAYEDGNNPSLSPIVTKIKNYILNVINTLNNPLDIALAIIGLLNCRESKENEKLIKQLLNMQRRDGGWPMSIFFNEGPYTEYRIQFGSEALTTAIALEAISKYIERC